MEDSQPKKLLILNILDILSRYSDADHKLSQKDIVDLLKEKYGMTAERKSVKRNLLNLIEFGYSLNSEESERINAQGEVETLQSQWYMDRTFSDAELRLMVDSLLFSKHIPNKQRKELIKKIEGLSSVYFSSKAHQISLLADNTPENKELFYNIEILDEAIRERKQVSFLYNEFGLDKKLHPRTDKSGKTRVYVVNPYQMAITNGRYYLICNYDKYDNMANYRIDRITKIKKLDSKVKPLQELAGFEDGLDLPKHMAEHIYMFTGKSERISFRAKRYILSDLFDWFGADMRFSDETADEVTVSVNVNLDAMRKWALQYALHVRVLSPLSLYENVKADIAKASENYQSVP